LSTAKSSAVSGGVSSWGIPKEFSRLAEV